MNIQIKKVGEMEVGVPVYLKKMEETLGRPPPAGKVFGGRLIPDQLEESERKRQEAFYKKRGKPYGNIDRMSVVEVDEFARDIKAALAERM